MREPQKPIKPVDPFELAKLINKHDWDTSAIEKELGIDDLSRVIEVYGWDHGGATPVKGVYGKSKAYDMDISHTIVLSTLPKDCTEINIGGYFPEHTQGGRTHQFLITWDSKENPIGDELKVLYEDWKASYGDELKAYEIALKKYQEHQRDTTQKALEAAEEKVRELRQKMKSS